MTAEELYKKLSETLPDIWWVSDDLEGIRVISFEVEEEEEQDDD